MGENVSLMGRWKMRWFMNKSFFFFLSFHKVAKEVISEREIEKRMGMWWLEGRSRGFK